MSDPVVYTDARKTSNAKIIEILRATSGLNPDEAMSRDDLIALCRENGIKVEDGKPVVVKATGEPIAYVINIMGNKDKREVLVGVNGIFCRIQCDTNVRVNAGVMESLRNAKEDILEQIKDNRTGEVTEEIVRVIPVHAVSIVETIYA